jgi:hypothetical protein
MHGTLKYPVCDFGSEQFRFKPGDCNGAAAHVLGLDTWDEWGVLCSTRDCRDASDGLHNPAYERIQGLLELPNIQLKGMQIRGAGLLDPCP